MTRLALLALLAACSSPPPAKPTVGNTTGSAAPGDKAKFRELLLAVNGHVTVLKMTPFTDYSDALAIVKKVAGVTSAEPIVLADGSATFAAAHTAIVMKGIPIGGAATREIEKRMIEGTTAALAEHPEQPRVVLGRGVAKQLGARVGDEVEIAVAADHEHPTPTPHTLVVAGIFYTGAGEYDDHLLLTTLAAAQVIRGDGDTATALELRVSNLDQASAIATEVGHALHDPIYRVMGWKELSPALAEP